MIITTDNYEEYFYRYCEGELTAEERAAVEAFAAQHPYLAEELSLYDPALKLEEPPMVYPDKESLLKYEHHIVPLWRWVAAACVAAVLIGGTWMVWRDTSNPTTEVAGTIAQLQKPSSIVETIEPQSTQIEVQPTSSTPTKALQQKAKPVAPLQNDPTEPLPQYVLVVEETQLLAEVEPLHEPAPLPEDTTVIEYIDIMLMPTRMPESEMVLVASRPTVSERFRAFRSRVSNTVRDYAYQTYSEARGELFARIDY